MIYRIQSDKETEIKNKIIQITIEKNKLKLLTQSTSITSQVPKNVTSKLPQKPPTASSTSLSSPQQQSQIKPITPVQLRSIPSPVTKHASENERKIELTENQNDCIKDHTLNQIDAKDICKANNATDMEIIDCKPVATVCMQKVNELNNSDIMCRFYGGFDFFLFLFFIA